MIATGRRKPPDRDKDHKHLLAKRPYEAKGVTKRIHHTVGPVLDQGSTSTCVVHACDKYLTTRPIYNLGWASLKERTKVYKEVQKLDEWPGEDYDGTSVRAMMKWLKDHGYITEYKWAFDCETVVNHVLAFGPLEMGTIWDEGMSQPDRYGYIAPNRDDSDDEGHAWTIVGADRERIHRPTGRVGAVRMINSWGTGWGDNGRAWITFEDLDRLIKAEGEAAVAMEIKRAPGS
jgi:C1A family cysteine protease